MHPAPQAAWAGSTTPPPELPRRRPLPRHRPPSGAARSEGVGGRHPPAASRPLGHPPQGRPVRGRPVRGAGSGWALRSTGRRAGSSRLGRRAPRAGWRPPPRCAAGRGTRAGSGGGCGGAGRAGPAAAPHHSPTLRPPSSLLRPEPYNTGSGWIQNLQHFERAAEGAGAVCSKGRLVRRAAARLTRLAALAWRLTAPWQALFQPCPPPPHCASTRKPHGDHDRRLV